MKTIGLCMIVKNEAAIILRCLESVRPLIDYVLIEDTGSTDGTQAIIRDYLKREKLRGLVFDEPWRDFAHNRSIALARLREKKDVDYALVMDADDVIVFDDGFDAARFKEGLSKDRYAVEMRIGAVVYRREQFLNNRKKFRYRGVLHEFLENVPGGSSLGIAEGFRIRAGTEGARSLDAEKYRKDAQVLERALQTETDPMLRARYTFYLARSYRDCREHEKAIDRFLERTTLGCWDQEVFWSYYSAGELQEALGRPVDEVLATYSKASDVVASRAEALHHASRLCRLNNRFAEGYELAKRGLAIAQPSDGLFLFVEAWIYQYGLLDEFAVNAYWCERYDESLDACERLLREGKLPDQMRERVQKNADFAWQKMASRPKAVPVAPEFTKSPEKAKLGIIVPYRDRPEHLSKFVPHMISYFRREKSVRDLDVKILVSEQADTLPFNRGGVMNAGFIALESMVDYVCFHDVDYLPMWADYSYTEMPTRIIWWGMHVRPNRAQNPTRWITAAKSGLGTVSLMSKEQFRVVNGFSNQYYGWGFEDSDLDERCRLHSFTIMQKDGTFIPLDHDNEGFNEDGSKSPAWVANEQRFSDNKAKYATHGTSIEGLSSFSATVSSIQREEFRGLDAAEKAEILRIFVNFD